MSRNLASLDARAQHLAELAHFGQVDKILQPYIDHPWAVVNFIPEVLDAFAECWGLEIDASTLEVIYAIAWLHDTVEDTWVTIGLLQSMQFGEAVIEGVSRMSRNLHAPASYNLGLKNHPIPRIVKVADMLHNTDPRRLIQLPDHRDRLLRKYRTMAEYLEVWEFIEAYHDLGVIEQHGWEDAAQILGIDYPGQRHPDSPNCVVLP